MANAHRTSSKVGFDNRRNFLQAMAKSHDRDAALAEVGLSVHWLYTQTARWADFNAAYQGLRRSRVRFKGGENRETEHMVKWDKTFAGFRQTFLGRQSPWFHVDLCDKMDKVEGGDVMLVIWPPEHGKTSLIEDRCTMDIATNADMRITVGKSKIDFAKMVVATVRQRFSPSEVKDDWWKLRERFGLFAPAAGFNAYQQPQVWAADSFNVFKRKLGVERDFNMQALGLGAEVAGTRCDRLIIDDPQSRKTLAQTDKILETMRDDWFTRPGTTGNTVILMNVVGDDDIAERLIDDSVCDHVSVLKAYDPDRYEALGPRLSKDGKMEVSPWLWPERFSERDYDRLRRNAGPEGWARKYQQDWRPSVGRTFTRDMWDACQNPLRRISNSPPRHPAGKVAQVACSIDPAFKRTAVAAACVEPTTMRVLDSTAQSALRTTAQMIDMLADQINHWHRPGISEVKWVVVETKGMQRGLITDDALLELQSEVGFEIISQETGWDKRDEDFGVAQMGRSMTRGEMDFPAGDDESIARFQSLLRELMDWRPDVHGNKQKMDEVMAVWFIYKMWHKQRRQSIRRGTNATQFGFGAIPTMPALVIPKVDLTGWQFGQVSSGPLRR